MTKSYIDYVNILIPTKSIYDSSRRKKSKVQVFLEEQLPYWQTNKHSKRIFLKPLLAL